MLSHKITNQIKIASTFILIISAFYSFFWLIITNLNLHFLKKITAIASNSLLHLFRVPSQLVLTIEPSIIIDQVTAQITSLCAGDIEIALLSAVILATLDRSLRKRLIGVLFGLILILIINPLRIFLVLLVGYYSSWQWADFTHDVLFRLTLLVVIVFYYFIWYVKYDSICKKVSHYLRH